MADIVFVHGMFQNPKSWAKWIELFTAAGHNCWTPAWPLHDGEPSDLRANPPAALGDLTFGDVVAAMETAVAGRPGAIVVGHSVGGLVAQVLLNKGLIAAGVAISPVAPNAMVDLDWGFISNSAKIANPLMGNAPIEMDAKTFHAAFANTMSEADAALAFQATATHDSRNVLRGCLGPDGRIDLDAPHGPLLMIGGEDDRIIPADLIRKNFEAYEDKASVTELEIFPGRSHYIVAEPGWQAVANRALAFVEQIGG